MRLLASRVRPRLLVLLLVAAAGLVTASGCGSSDGASPATTAPAATAPAGGTVPAGRLSATERRSRRCAPFSDTQKFSAHVMEIEIAKYPMTCEHAQGVIMAYVANRPLRDIGGYDWTCTSEHGAAHVLVKCRERSRQNEEFEDLQFIVEKLKGYKGPGA